MLSLNFIMFNHLHLLSASYLNPLMFVTAHIIFVGINWTVDF